jgi:DNA-binding response OmpR family regulator
MERILIIEDEESILMALEDDLKLEGYQVTGIEDGQQGLSMRWPARALDGKRRRV